MNPDIAIYNNEQEGVRKDICELLVAEIHKNMDGTAGVEHKIWHGAPVWFLNGNPIVGYSARKNDIQLLFWSGQSFGEPGLEVEGTFKAAQVRYTDTDQVNVADLHNWIEKAKIIQWDYKNIVKRRGELIRLEVA